MTKIDYISSERPIVELPELEGDRYEALVPDTLDLAERARLAIHGMTAPTNPAADYEQYFHIDLFHNPPILMNNYADSCVVKFMDTVPLMRQMSGSDAGRDVEQTWMEALLRSFGPDGLIYHPVGGRPWAWEGTDLRMGPIWRPDGSHVPIGDPEVTQFSTQPYLFGRWINAMTLYYLRDGNAMWRTAIERMIARIAELWVDGPGYFPDGIFEPGATVPPAANYAEFCHAQGLPPGGVGEYAMLDGLVNYHRLVGHEPALELAGKLAHASASYRGPEGLFFDDEGRFNSGFRFVPGQIEELQPGHFHAHTIVILHLLEYAVVAGDDELLDFANRSFEYACALTSPTLGWVPKNISRQYGSDIHPTGTVLQRSESETCAVADMIELALRLSAAGAGDYWDEADRWTRNYFAECQLTRTRWIDNLVRPQSRRIVQANESDDRVAERSVGGFAGYPGVNQWALHTGLQQCCTGNGARTLYTIWDHALQHEQGRLRVNLLLNRVSPWADVHSHIPYRGQVDLDVKTSCSSLAVRAPQWVASGSAELVCRVNGSARSTDWQGRTVEVGAVGAGDRVELTFPIAEHTEEGLAGGVAYLIDVKGSTVVHMSPPGRQGPLYLRDHYRENETRWVKRQRFVPSTPPNW